MVRMMLKVNKGMGREQYGLGTDGNTKKVNGARQIIYVGVTATRGKWENLFGDNDHKEGKD